MRLIDADNVRDLFDAEFKETRKLILSGETHLDNLAEGFLESDRVIREMPTVNAEVVVRCKDCKHSRPLNNNEKERFIDGVLMCTHPEVSEYGITDVWGTHFCSYGERKDGDNAT